LRTPDRCRPEIGNFAVAPYSHFRIGRRAVDGESKLITFAAWLPLASWMCCPHPAVKNTLPAKRWRVGGVLKSDNEV
jgi:hypothetical protein